jgi:hypothetical protein
MTLKLLRKMNKRLQLLFRRRKKYMTMTQNLTKTSEPI